MLLVTALENLASISHFNFDLSQFIESNPFLLRAIEENASKPLQKYISSHTQFAHEIKVISIYEQ